jgi:hypothetical protein
MQRRHTELSQAEHAARAAQLRHTTRPDEARAQRDNENDRHVITMLQTEVDNPTLCNTNDGGRPGVKGLPRGVTSESSTSSRKFESWTDERRGRRTDCGTMAYSSHRRIAIDEVRR